ncbi:SMP-30/gluconolactonase/LRE family protein [Streptomyces fuscichromogenes]|uniref:SMP-30/Gluconolactonase/LRE-like region domain-containing protein n=1 Tax=Streptomyces fuscichromogenes TaxID=1324013 RepID=A0A917X9P4_9ACTN|nr:SMP-30/gluconolactonase/LRE family protein [Streptomyces fuscichromogenes]GGM97974.1 hypothetical protein GCM10011578_018630 [Streptomyces fuscichromogenes]
MDTLAEGGSFFEGPRWHAGRWWVSDFFRHGVFSCAADGGDLRLEAVLDKQPSGLGREADGCLLIVSMLDRRLPRRTRSGALEVVADLGSLAEGPCNDTVVDPAGRAWIGSFGRVADRIPWHGDFGMLAGAPPYAPSALLRVDPGGTASAAADGLLFPNGCVITGCVITGCVITADGSTLIAEEMFAARYTAFTIAGDGSLVDRRVWAELPGACPDGCCLDAAGRVVRRRRGLRVSAGRTGRARRRQGGPARRIHDVRVHARRPLGRHAAPVLCTRCPCAAPGARR